MLIPAIRGSTFSSRPAGFSLIELMVAMTLGILLSIGIVTLFGATSKTNKVQDSLARLQENGRYAITRINSDLRMLGAQYCDAIGSTGWTATAANGPQYPSMAIYANVAGVSNVTASKAFPDSDAGLGLAPTGWTAGKVYPLSPATFVRGYDCALAGNCTPAVPSMAGADGLPAEGTTDGTRVRGADVLTIRYQRGTGWPFAATGAGTAAQVTLTRTIISATEGDDKFNFSTNDRALITTCGGGQLFQNAVTCSPTATTCTLTPAGGSLLAPATFQPNGRQGGFDARVFNFDRDFVTVSYYLAYKNDGNPDQPGRVIPVLVRKVNGSATPDEIVQGVERLDFTYGVQFKDGTFQYLKADQVASNSDAAHCPPPPAEWDTATYGAVEPGCLWRSVKSIQVNMLLDSINNVYDLSLPDTSYRYTIDNANMATPPATAGALMSYNGVSNGSITGRMMRREFVSIIATRNGNH
jgi:type IV pilus assembly protein PilW